MGKPPQLTFGFESTPGTMREIFARLQTDTAWANDPDRTYYGGSDTYPSERPGYLQSATYRRSQGCNDARREGLT